MEITTDFAKYLTKFFTEYLVGERGASSHTIRSYRDTFTLVLTYMDKVRHIAADRLTLTHFYRETILDFLDWLQKDRKCANSTKNQRLAALHSFFTYMQYEDVKHLEQWQDILSIKVKRQGKRSSVNYLTVEGIKFLLEQVPVDTKKGRRDLALLALLYDSGARVQELIDLSPSSLNLNKPCYVTILGKGNKKRIVPLQNEQVKLLTSYMKEHHLDNPAYNQWPLFANNRREKLTTSGVTYILNLYAHNARVLKPDFIPEKISPHTLRHSKAMHLLQSGVNLVYIRYPNKNIILTFKVRYQIFNLITCRKFGLYLDYFPLLNNADSFSLSLPHFCGSDLVFSSSNDIIAFACISVVMSR